MPTEILDRPIQPPRHPALDEEQVRQLQAWLRLQPFPNISPEELEIHVQTMPDLYWERNSREEVVWGMETVGEFLKLVATASGPAVPPSVTWRPASGGQSTRVMLCTWDRRGLLAKAAAAFSAVGLSILHAEAFTRKDNLVVDTFEVIDSAQGGQAAPKRLEEMAFLLEGALSNPPRFASVWACSKHRLLAAPRSNPPLIQFDNTSSETATTIRVQGADRLGFLYDLLQTLADAGLNVTQAVITTLQGMAHDLIEITDAEGKQVTDPKRLDALRVQLENALE